MSDRSEAALTAIKGQIGELTRTRKEVEEGAIGAAFGRDWLRSWKRRTSAVLADYIPASELNVFAESVLEGYAGNDLLDFRLKAAKCENRLRVLREELQTHGDRFLAARLTETAGESAPREAPAGRAVFIIYGHDEQNRLRLEKLLREHWHVDKIILEDEPARGRTMIEKFEQEARRASYAIALLTPDDMVSFEDQGKEYAQARPNVVFELGWFYAHLTRENVCILMRKGTKIHSDLEGINRIDFHTDVKEITTELERELEAAGVLPRRG